ncbi:MAG: Holliday junction branch migration protein RuvA [Myxococcales bacterium]|nr:Holliday junction branch migration protein RuvA [Myxococcales bacterium]
MIARVEGVLRDKEPTRIVIDVAGVGYELHVSLHSYAALPDEGKTVAMHVHTHVREEAIQLFGFASRAERDVFELLLRASRVGPRLAQTVLSGMPPERLLASLRASDVTALCRIPGVGRKLAERMVVELRDRAAELALGGAGAAASAGAAAAPAASAEDEALSALTNLGYPRAQAEKVVAAARAEAGDGASTEALIRAALRGLAG